MALLVGQHPSTTFFDHWARLLTVALIVLTGASPLDSWQVRSEPLHASQSTLVSAVFGSGESGFSGVISTSVASEEQEDTDPTDLGPVFGVLCIAILMLRGAWLLSAPYQGPMKLTSICCSAVEQPG